MSDIAIALAATARGRSERHLETLGQPIKILVAQCESYTTLLRGECSEPKSPRMLLEWASRFGRLMISGRGASGKSSLMNRLVIEAAESKRLPVLLDLSRWDHAATEEWGGVGENHKQAFDLLLRRFQPDNIDVLRIESVAPETEKMILVDGLNEVPGPIAEQILGSCDRLASLLINCSVIVSDRLIRRRLDGEGDRWGFAMPLPVDQAEIDRLVQPGDVPVGVRSLLDNPFFLDRAIRQELRSSALATIRDLIENRGGILPEKLPALARAAFLAYEQDRSRAFLPERLVEAGAGDALEPLLQGGILLPAGEGRVAFAHHWYHDFLASRHVTGHPEMWSFTQRQHTLDTLTFKANSFDAIAFALEQLAGSGSDDFLRAVYDWNPYAAGYALAETEAADVNAVSPALRTVILAMLADKRFDRHFLSAERAKDALDLFRDEGAISLRETGSRRELIELVAVHPQIGDEFARWREVFVTQPGAEAPEDLVDALLDDDSIVGWTAANVLKNLRLSEGQIQRLTMAAREAAPVVRWRACHVLGSSKDQAALDLLLDRVVNDEDESVRYGAIRSLVEIASLSDKLAAIVTRKLQPLLPQIAAWPRVMAELTKAVFLSRGYSPKNWSSCISELLYTRASASHDTADMVEWSRLSSRLRQHEREMEGAPA